MKQNEKLLLTLHLKSQSDVLLARRRGRQIAVLLGFGLQDQIRISTAVSEIVRNALVHANGGKIEFYVSDSEIPFSFAIEVTDKGSGIDDVNAILEENSLYHGLKGARQLVDSMHIDTKSSGTTIRLEKELLLRTAPFTAREIDQLANSLTKVVGMDPLDEIHQQNQELLTALDQISSSQIMLAELNEELKRKNDELVRLYAEMRVLNNSLEDKVAQRTADLEGARDDAIRANELKSQFVANISHEIRTPMSGILGLSEILTIEADGELKETAEHIHGSAQNLMSIVNDLLDMSKLEAGKIEMKRETFEIDSMVDEVLTAFEVTASSKNLILSQRIDGLVRGNVNGPGERIRQVLQNLVQNAIKFTDEGSIEISVDQQNRDQDTSYVKFSVIDTGPGISAENQKKLFQLFVQVDGSSTRRHGGTGLGLALSKRLVELMGGRIGVDSKDGSGSTFWFTIPLDVGTTVQ